ncbi:ATP-binding protein [Streptomyces sodiiphilus]
MSSERVWEYSCPGLPEEVARARRITRDVLVDTPYADDAGLIVSELGANAITHTASAKHGFRLTITRAPEGTVTLAVTDTGGTGAIPEIKQPRQHRHTRPGIGHHRRLLRPPRCPPQPRRPHRHR